jgi:hypothetical protein
MVLGMIMIHRDWANAVTIGDTTKRAAYVSAAVGTAVSNG